MPQFPLLKVSYTGRKSAYQVLAALLGWGMGVLICTEKPKLHESPSEAHLLPPSHSGSQGPRCHFPPMCLLGNLVPGARSGPATVAFRVGGGCGAWPAFASPPILGKAAGGALRDDCESAHRNVEDALFRLTSGRTCWGPGAVGLTSPCGCTAATCALIRAASLELEPLRSLQAQPPGTPLCTQSLNGADNSGLRMNHREAIPCSPSLPCISVILSVVQRR